MSLFRNLGERAERFKRAVTDAAADEATHVCADCGQLLYTQRDECPNCGAEAIVERDVEDTDEADPDEADPDATVPVGDDAPADDRSDDGETLGGESDEPIDELIEEAEDGSAGDTRREVEGAEDPQEGEAKKAGAREADAQEADAREADAREADAQEADAQEADAQEADARTDERPPDDS